jgi:hypothetical protein
MKMTRPRILNLTAHDILVFHSDGEQYVIPPSGVVARARSEHIPGDPLDIFDTVRCEYGKIAGLPDPEKGTYLIVSGLVLNVLNGSRPDCLAPDTGQTAIRDDNGNIIAVRRFLRGG